MMSFIRIDHCKPLTPAENLLLGLVLILGLAVIILFEVLRWIDKKEERDDAERWR